MSLLLAPSDVEGGVPSNVEWDLEADRAHQGDGVAARNRSRLQVVRA
jgi:hypothetical protein